MNAKLVRIHGPKKDEEELLMAGEVVFRLERGGRGSGGTFVIVVKDKPLTTLVLLSSFCSKSSVQFLREWARKRGKEEEGSR